MAFLYAMSDIHGKYSLFIEALGIIGIEETQDRLILLGDYIDRGEDSLKTLLKVKELTDLYPDRVHALMGNHEQLLLEDVVSDFYTDSGIKRMASLLPPSQKKEISLNQDEFGIWKQIQRKLLTSLKNVLEWVGELPLFIETTGQIFVHAGIEEEEGENWEEYTSEHTALWLRANHFGTFYKDIISGHTPTPVVSNDPDFYDIYWDGQSHFYIDGCAFRSERLQILRFDETTKEYASYNYEKQEFCPIIPYERKKEETSPFSGM